MILSAEDKRQSTYAKASADEESTKTKVKKTFRVPRSGFKSLAVPRQTRIR